MANIVKISNIHIYDIFEWMWNHIQDSGGDGGAALVCANPKETAKEFARWVKADKDPECDITKCDFPNQEKRDPFTENENEVRFDWWYSQENLCFSNKYYEKIVFPGEYCFIVEKDCLDVFRNKDNPGFIIKGIN